MSTTYLILENGQPMDGEFYTHDKLFKALPYADYDARVLAFDEAEVLRDGATSMRDVTEDMVCEAWAALNRSEREDLIERGFFELASRFISDEYAALADVVDGPAAALAGMGAL